MGTNSVTDIVIPLQTRVPASKLVDMTKTWMMTESISKTNAIFT